MGRVGTKRYIDFRVVDPNTSPVTGLVLGDFTVYFTRNGLVCSDPISLAGKGSGRYLATYVPTAAGFDFVELYNAANDVRVQDAEQIDSPETFFDIGSETKDITQDFGFVGALRLNLANPRMFVIYFFRSQDWQIGNTFVSFALAATPVDASGNWTTSPLTVLKDTYHVVAMNGLGSVHVISAFLKVQ